MSRSSVDTPEGRPLRFWQLMTSTVERGDIFQTMLREVKERTELSLRKCFANLRLPAGEVQATFDTVAELTLRGGKRLRPALLYASYVAAGGEPDPASVGGAFVALELLQSYLLIHDDWMDGDDTRRGGPSVHAMLTKRYSSEREGAVGAILAGDLASALAQRALLDVCVPEARLVEAGRQFATMQAEVVSGQILDVRAEASIPEEMERMHDLKTGSYTVAGPVALGAALAGASKESIQLLMGFARPLGIAFQLRDDLLGVFGDPSETGKPQHTDLWKKKRTALMVDLLVHPQTTALISDFLAGTPDAASVARVVDAMEVHGTKARVEARVSELANQSEANLRALDLREPGKTCLLQSIDLLAHRKV